MPALRHKQFWRYLRPLAAPLLILALVLTLWEPISWWLNGEERYDRHALKEWIQEAKTGATLPELVAKLLDANSRYLRQVGDARQLAGQQRDELRQQVLVHLRALGEPVTKMYSAQLPLFPVIYRLEVKFDDALHLDPIVWDSALPRQTTQYRRLPPIRLDERGAYVAVQYHLRVYAWQQAQEREDSARRFRLGGLALAASVVVLVWIYLAQRRQRQRQRQHLLAQQKVGEVERLRLQEALRRQEAERRREEAERVTLELKSQLFANISIMAGSYAHNIKNLLIRPNDLLSRCLEHDDGLSAEQGQMLREVRHTLGTVTERLQQILQTVRRDPTRSEHVRIDLNDLARDMGRTWDDLAREKWKLTLTLELAPEPLVVAGDHSHLQQALENLVFNARDATFEMRSYLREQARQRGAVGPGPEDNGPAGDGRRQALIAAAAWKGVVALRTRREGDRAVLEVQDNGIGMTEEVQQRCLHAHFSTKRNNALFEGQGAGMGLGLTFVGVILEHHHAVLSVVSEPLRGTTFRASFPLAATRG